MVSCFGFLQVTKVTKILIGFVCNFDSVLASVNRLGIMLTWRQNDLRNKYVAVQIVLLFGLVMPRNVPIITVNYRKFRSIGRTYI